MISEDSYLQKAEELQRVNWTKANASDLRGMLFNKVLQKALGKVLLESDAAGSMLVRMGLGTQEEVIKATKLQGTVAGHLMFFSRLLELAREDEKDGQA